MKRLSAGLIHSAQKQTGRLFAGPSHKSQISHHSAVGAQTLLVAAALHPLGEQEGKLECLVGIETRVAMGVVAILQILGADSAGAARAFGHVLAGHLDVDAARMRAFGAMDLEEAFDLRQDALERTRLVVVECDRVAMHRIAGPDDLTAFLLDGADKARQIVGDLVMAETADQRQTAGFVLRIEYIDQVEQVVRL